RAVRTRADQWLAWDCEPLPVRRRYLQCHCARSSHAFGWQWHELVIIRSAFAQTFLNFDCVLATLSGVFFFFRKLFSGPSKDQPFSGKRARSSRYTCSASAKRCCFIKTAPSE